MSSRPRFAARIHAGRRPINSTSALALVFAVALLAAGCAASKALGRGRAAERAEDYDRAVVEYANAVRLSPDDADARLALDRAKLRASMQHFERGRRLDAAGSLDQALVEFEAAAELNPANGDIDAALRATRAQLRSRVAVAREGKTELQTIVETARTLPPPGLDLPTDVKMPASMVFSSQSSRMVFQAIAKLAGISVGFDDTFRDSSITVDLRNATLEDALTALASQTRSFFRVTAPRTVLIIPDTPAKRREYEEEVVQVFYLSNVDLKETIDLLRMVLDARRIAPTAAVNALTIKDTPERLAAAGRVLAAIDKARPEVIIDVEVLEVDRSRLKEYGLQIASPESSGISGSVGLDASRTFTLRSLNNLSQSDVLFANLPGLYYRLLKSDSNTRTLAAPQLRAAEGMTAQARFGEKIPIPVTQFVPIATGGIPQQPTTTFNYQNIGVDIDITPRTHHDDDVSLALRIAVQSLSGSGFGDLPTFGNREVNTVIRLRDGETSMLAGLIRDDEREVIQGVPGLSDIPLVGRMFAHTRTQTTQTDIILTITPHIIRVLDVSPEDLRAFRVGRDSLSGAELPPLPIDIPPPQDAPPAVPVPPGQTLPPAGQPAPTPPPPGGLPVAAPPPG